MNESNPSSGTPAHTTAAPRRRRRWPWVLVALLLVLGGIVAAAPSLLSTPGLTNLAVDRVNRTIPGRIAVGDLSLSWLGSQSLSALSISDEQGQPVLSLEEFTTELSLLEALRSRLSLGTTVIRGLTADLVFNPGGTSNLARALGGPTTEQPDEPGGLVVPVTGNMTLTDSRVSIAAPDIEPVLLQNLRGTVSTTGRDSPIELSFSGQSRQGDLEGSVEVTGTISGLFAGAELTPAAAKTDVTATIRDLPVDAVDRLFNMGGLLSAALGDRTSVSVKAGGDAHRQQVAVDLQAGNGELKLDGVVADGRFQLSAPASARLDATPALVDAVSAPARGDPAFRLAAPVPLHLTVEQLDVSLNPFEPSTTAVRAGLDARGPVRLTDIADVGEVTINDFTMLVDGPVPAEAIRVRVNGKPSTRGETGGLAVDAEFRNLFDAAGNLQADALTVRAESSITGVPTALLDALLDQDGLLVDAAGPIVGLTLNADTDPAGNIAITVNAQSDRIQTGPVRLAVNDHITLAEPARIRFTLTPELARRFAGEASAYHLAQSSELTLDLKSLQWPMPAADEPVFRPAGTRLEAALSTPALVVRNANETAPMKIEALALNLAGASLDALQLSGSTRLVQSGGTLSSLDASPLDVKLDARTGLNDDASLQEITGSLAFDGPGLRTSMDVRIESGFRHLSLTGPASFALTVTPELLAAWQQGEGPKATLREAAAVEGSLERLDVPLSPFSYAGTVLQGRLGADRLVIESSESAATTIENAVAEVSFEGADRGSANLKLNARVQSAGDPGDLSLSVAAGNVLDADGEPSGEALSLELDGSLAHLPVALVDQLLNMDGLTVATLGPTADVNVTARLENMRGPFTLSLNAPNTRADIKARFEEQGLTLTEPLVAEVEPTPEFGKKVLSKVHPIFETTQRAERPVRFEMPAEGVLIPVENYDFSRVTVPKMTLDFGKVVLKSGWLLRGVIGLGQQFGKLDSVQREEWVAWFTPGVMEITGGKVVYSRRLDLLLAKKLHLATWGEADVGNDRSNLTLAFMPDTMERVFSITVAENDALYVPVTGPLSAPSIDFKSAGKDLARLRAQEEVAGENPLAGLLLGAATGKAAGGGGGSSPPPSITPLPWAEELAARDAAERQQRQQAPGEQPAGQQEPAQAAPAKKPSTEEEVIKGLIDIFGKKKQE